MSHAEQLEQETEQTRAQLSATLDELRASMTPGRVIDQLADRITEGAPAEFARNLKDQAVANPLPIAVISTGLAWLMLSSRKSTAAQASSASMSNVADTARSWAGGAVDASRGVVDSGSEMTEAARQRAADAAGTISETAGSLAGSARDSAVQAATRVRETAGSVTESMQRTAAAMSDAARSTGQRTLRSGSAFVDFCREQPLVLAGLGLAAGAIIGALFPATETENQLMGESSDAVKARAQDVATEQIETAKVAGKRAFDAAKDAAKDATKDDATKDGAAEPKSDEGGNKFAGETANAQDRHRERHDEVADAAAEVRTHEDPTLVPSDRTELERRGLPWTPEDAPL